jgi:hypothetical protein
MIEPYDKDTQATMLDQIQDDIVYATECLAEDCAGGHQRRNGCAHSDRKGRNQGNHCAQEITTTR